MIIREKFARSILSKSQIYDYTINPYVGCSHSCRYCYAAFMKRFTGHAEKWGAFVDVKCNAPELLAREIAKKRVGRIWISGVSDPYQPAEKKYKLTRMCLEILASSQWPVTIQTKSPLVLRDIEILEKFADVEVGFSIATADEQMRKIFEPGAPPIRERIAALGTLHLRRIKTYAMIAPILPGAEELVNELVGKVDYVLTDRMNYHHANPIYRQNHLEWAQEDSFFHQTGDMLKKEFERAGISVQVLF